MKNQGNMSPVKANNSITKNLCDREKEEISNNQKKKKDTNGQRN
jgi:hypothetical protein